jgi:hypothetical protein
MKLELDGRRFGLVSSGEEVISSGAPELQLEAASGGNKEKLAGTL